MYKNTIVIIPLVCICMYWNIDLKYEIKHINWYMICPHSLAISLFTFAMYDTEFKLWFPLL